MVLVVVTVLLPILWDVRDSTSSNMIDEDEHKQIVGELESERNHYQEVANNYSDNSSYLREQAEYYKERSKNQSEIIEIQNQEIEELEGETERELTVRNIHKYNLILPIIERPVNIVFSFTILVVVPVSISLIKFKLEISIVEELAQLYNRRHKIREEIKSNLQTLKNRISGIM